MPSNLKKFSRIGRRLYMYVYNSKRSTVINKYNPYNTSVKSKSASITMVADFYNLLDTF